MEIKAIELYNRLKECKTDLEKIKLILEELNDAYDDGQREGYDDGFSDGEDSYEGGYQGMTIYCKGCKTIPSVYTTIIGRTLCLVCARKEYLGKLKQLKEEYSSVSFDIFNTRIGG